MLLLPAPLVENPRQDEAQYWQQCELLYDMDERIHGCTMLLRRGELSADFRSIILLQRGVAYSEKGDMMRAKSDLAEAIKEFDAILRQDPENVDALLNRGVAYRASGDLARGLANYDEAIRLDPLNASAYNTRCWARALSGVELELARRDCDEAIRLSNRDHNSLDSRGLVSLKLGDFAGAWALYDEAARARPGTARFLYGRGLAAMLMGDTLKGNADIDEALRLDPDVGEMYERYAIAP